MTVREYNDVLVRVSTLSQREKVDLLVELARQVRDNSRTHTKRSIMELEGLGKEIWANVDAQEYVDQERDAWDG